VFLNLFTYLLTYLFTYFLHWDIRGTKRKPGKSRKNWRDAIKQDLKSICMTWEHNGCCCCSLSTEKAGVDVWPNVSLTRDELRTKDLLTYLLTYLLTDTSQPQTLHDGIGRAYR